MNNDAPTQPAVSLIIPTFNRKDLLKETLDSIVAQTLPHWETIVVDDGSTDGSVEALKQCAAEDARIRPMSRTGEAGGAPICRNQGLAAATGRYVIYLDSDDLLGPDALAQRVAVMDAEPTMDFITFPMEFFRETPGDIGTSVSGASDESDLDRLLMRDFPWQITCPIWRIEAMNALGGFDPQLPAGQDVELHIRAIASGMTYRKDDRRDCYYRMHDNERVGGRFMSPTYVHGMRLLQERILQTLRGHNQLTPARQASIAGNFFWLAECWFHLDGDIKRPLEIWSWSRELGVVGWFRYQLIRMGFRLYRHERLKRWIRRQIASSWPAYFRVGRVSHSPTAEIAARSSAADPSNVREVTT